MKLKAFLENLNISKIVDPKIKRGTMLEKGRIWRKSEKIKELQSNLIYLFPKINENETLQFKHSYLHTKKKNH